MLPAQVKLKAGWSGGASPSLAARLRIVARHFGVKERDVGYAGLKDRAAITRQLVSVHTPGKGPADFSSLEHDKLKVLWVDKHANKLRQGHLAGNRFIVRIRGVNPTDAVRAHRVVSRLEKTGVPRLRTLSA
mgnify:CR=1 FL=1